MTNGQINVDAVRDLYDCISGAYHAWLGEHLHHGYWESVESFAAAQERLAERARILNDRLGRKATGCEWRRITS